MNQNELKNNSQGVAKTPAALLIQPFRPIGARGLTASPLLNAPQRVVMQLVFDVVCALRSAAEMPHFAEETRIFLIECIEHILEGEGDASLTAIDEFTFAAKQFYALKALDMKGMLRLVQAAKRDVSRPTCATWSDLMLYCRYAAEPVARMSLMIHQEPPRPEVEKAADALSAALLVMNKMRRMRRDWQLHGRCYIPTDWFAQEKTSPEQLIKSKPTPEVARVLARTLERVGGLLEMAQPLPHLATSPTLKAEATRL